MKIIIADSCSLILLAKCNLLGALAGKFPLLIPDAVFHEVVNEGTAERFSDAKVVSALVEQKRIKVVKAAKPKRLPFAIGKGELEALLLVKQTPGAVLATDDGKAIKVCRHLNLPFIISPKIAVELYRLKMIDRHTAKSAIEKMKIIGRYSADIIAEALLMLEEARNA